MILVKDPPRCKVDEWILMEESERFIGMVSDSTLQLAFKETNI